MINAPRTSPSLLAYYKNWTVGRPGNEATNITTEEIFLTTVLELNNQSLINIYIISLIDQESMCGTDIENELMCLHITVLAYRLQHFAQFNIYQRHSGPFLDSPRSPVASLLDLHHRPVFLVMQKKRGEGMEDSLT